LLKTSSRRQFLFAITATGALVAAGGAAWAAWYLGGSGSASTRSASALGLELSAHPRPDMPLYPGARTDLSVAVRNPNPFPVVVTNVRVGTGPVTVDAAHRGAGCVTTGVLATRGSTAVSLTVRPPPSQRPVLTNPRLQRGRGARTHSRAPGVSKTLRLGAVAGGAVLPVVTAAVGGRSSSRVAAAGCRTAPGPRAVAGAAVFQRGHRKGAECFRS
jgi:hypothetical protein